MTELTLSLPEAITPDLEDILSKMCFEFIAIAQVMRATGHVIAHRAEAEQAHCLYWLLRLHAVHGAGWRAAASAEVRAMRDKALAKAEPTP